METGLESIDRFVLHLEHKFVDRPSLGGELATIANLITSGISRQLL